MNGSAAAIPAPMQDGPPEGRIAMENGAEGHPLAHDVNKEHCESLSPVERMCRRIADSTGAPLALGLAVLVQAVWIPVGIVTKWDPFPFAFLLTCSNVLQLILIFILAVGQRQSAAHAELRAEHDHDAISRLLYHQEVQERLLVAITKTIKVRVDETGLEIDEIEGMIRKLASEDAAPA